MNRDFVEMLHALSDAGADFLIVGAHARAVYGEPRATKDLDIWVRADEANARCVWSALAAFGAPMTDLALEDLSRPGITFQLGVPPYRIDILTELTGVTFDEAWANRTSVQIGGVIYPVIGKREFVRNKRATGRPQDLIDADHVEDSPIG
ncbi:MAG TPA: hypothetical protein VEO54_00285 [Thermoanaerobaculia bacterium]|nr:hypothetical protein [Thermoanaerobaculia bacterium]